MNKSGYFGKKALILTLITGLLLGSGVSYAFLPRQTEEIMAYTPLFDLAPSFLFVQQAASGSLIHDVGASTYTLTLNSVASQVQFFSDRPQRISGQSSIDIFVARWDSRGFDEEPPNAALVLIDAQSQEDTVIVELTNPNYNSQTKTLQYTATIISNSQSEVLVYHKNRADNAVPEQFGRVNLFIDDAAPIGDLVTVGWSKPSSSYNKMLSGAVVAIGNQARTYLGNLDENKMLEAVGVNEELPVNAVSGVLTIDPYGTEISNEEVSEFDVYFGLLRTPDKTDVQYIFGYTVTIQPGAKNTVFSPFDGVVLASGDWDAINGTAVKQGEAMFSIETTNGRAITLQVADILEGNLPFGVTAKQIYFDQH
ncbi:MAG: hypothetical protein ACFCUE_14075 [Candidatus Bathyarchaeia archaeon]|jgi:hypothetical protein